MVIEPDVFAPLTKAAIFSSLAFAGLGSFADLELKPTMFPKLSGTTVSGVNRVTLDLDPTAHAEVCAIRNACREIDSFDLTGFTLVSSCKPCPLCLAASMWARVGNVFYAADRTNAAAAGFDDAAFYELMDAPRSQWRSAPT